MYSTMYTPNTYLHMSKQACILNWPIHKLQIEYSLKRNQQVFKMASLCTLDHLRIDAINNILLYFLSIGPWVRYIALLAILGCVKIHLCNSKKQLNDNSHC